MQRPWSLVDSVHSDFEEEARSTGRRLVEESRCFATSLNHFEPKKDSRGDHPGILYLQNHPQWLCYLLGNIGDSHPPVCGHAHSGHCSCSSWTGYIPKNDGLRQRKNDGSLRSFRLLDSFLSIFFPDEHAMISPSVSEDPSGGSGTRSSSSLRRPSWCFAHPIGCSS